MEKLYTCKEIAEMYHVKISTVWDWIREGKLGAVSIGRIYRVRQSDIDKFAREKSIPN